MRKIYVKYQILVNGFNVLSPYTIDGFIIKDEYLNEEIYKSQQSISSGNIPINLNYFIHHCLVDYDKLKVKYFESKDYFEYELSDDINFDVNEGQEIFENNPRILETVFDLEKKLRIIFNIPILFQVIYIEFFDENKNKMFNIFVNNKVSSWNRAAYPISKKELENNSRFSINFELMKNTNNKHFNRALEFYNESFENDKLSTRFILIFSSLETIFNLDSECVTKKLAKYTAKLLSEDNKLEYKKIEKDIRRLYKARGKYIHGFETDCITIEDEILLRRYTRRVIIVYWYIVLLCKMSSRQILKELDSDRKFDIMIRQVIAVVNATSFFEQQHKSIDLIEKEIGREIPKYCKDKLLELCGNVKDKDEN